MIMFSKLYETFLGCFVPMNIAIFGIRIHDSQGDLTDTSAKTKSLIASMAACEENFKIRIICQLDTSFQNNFLMH